MTNTELEKVFELSAFQKGKNGTYIATFANDKKVKELMDSINITNMSNLDYPKSSIQYFIPDAAIVPPDIMAFLKEKTKNQRATSSPQWGLSPSTI